MPPLEIEVKLALPDRAAFDALCAALGEARATRLQRNAFFDGPRREISTARLALRAREERVAGSGAEAPRTLVTLKRGGATDGSVHARTEWEAEIPVPWDDLRVDPSRLLRFPVDPIRELRCAIPGLDRLVWLGHFENERRETPVWLEVVGVSGGRVGLETLWELDRTTFGAGPTQYELEVELPTAGRDRVRAEALAAAVKEKLQAWGVPWREEPLSKYERFRRACMSRLD